MILPGNMSAGLVEALGKDNMDIYEKAEKDISKILNQNKFPSFKVTPVLIQIYISGMQEGLEQAKKILYKDVDKN